MNTKIIFIKIIALIYMLMRLSYSYATDRVMNDNNVGILIHDSQYYSSYSPYSSDFALATDILFKENEHYISYHQPYKGTSVNRFKQCHYSRKIGGCRPEAVLTVKAGRHDTVFVAKRFNNWINNSANSSIFHAFPDTLNFAVKGTLTYTLKRYQCHRKSHSLCKLNSETGQKVTIDDLIFAQDKHKWWVASSNCTDSYSKIEKLRFFKTVHIGSITCKTREGGKVCISTFGGYSFNILHGPC